MKILVVQANPADQAVLRLAHEIRQIKERITSAAPWGFELVSECAVRISDLQGLLLRHRPDIVHFSGHGMRQGSLFLRTTLVRVKSYLSELWAAFSLSSGIRFIAWFSTRAIRPGKSLGMGTVSFLVFVVLSLRVKRGSNDADVQAAQTRRGVEITDLTKLAGARLADSFTKAGPALSALVASILYLLIGTLGAGLDRLAQH